MSTTPKADEECKHPNGRLSNPRAPTVGDAFSGNQVSIVADCECGALVLLDCSVSEVMELE